MEDIKPYFYTSVSTFEELHGPTIIVVIPTRNEAPNLRHAFPYIPAIVSGVIHGG